MASVVLAAFYGCEKTCPKIVVPIFFLCYCFVGTREGMRREIPIVPLNRERKKFCTKHANNQKKKNQKENSFARSTIHLKYHN